MFQLTQRLATLGAKSKSATRTAKDGEEYSQLVLEVDTVVSPTEICDLFGTSKAWDALKAACRELKGVTSVEVDDKFEEATVIMRMAAVSAENGPEFTFAGCTIDRVTLSASTSEDGAHCSFRVIAKPDLDAKFGQLIERLGHTIMVEVRAIVPADQTEMDLDEDGQRIAQQIEDERNAEAVH